MCSSQSFSFGMFSIFLHVSSICILSCQYGIKYLLYNCFKFGASHEHVCIPFVICVIGVKIGNKFGDKYERKAETVGGLILILMGIKILLEHLGIF